jgi:hypothetical protein
MNDLSRLESGLRTIHQVMQLSLRPISVQLDITQKGKFAMHRDSYHRSYCHTFDRVTLTKPYWIRRFINKYATLTMSCIVQTDRIY